MGLMGLMGRELLFKQFKFQKLEVKCRGRSSGKLITRSG